MNKTTTKFALGAMLLMSGMSFGQTRYVSATGNDVSNDCTTIGLPCLTMEKAAMEAITGDSIIVAPGTYEITSTLNLSTSGITLVGQVASDKPVITSTTSNIVNVSASDITISDLIFKMGLKSSNGMKGIVGAAGYNNLTVSGNEFYSINPGGSMGNGMVFGSYAIHLYAPSSTPLNVTIDNNTIAMESTENAAFGRGLGIGLNAGSTHGPGGDISNNDIAAYYPIQSIEVGMDLSVTNNHLMGMTMFNAPMNGAVTTLTNNTFDGVADQYASNIFTLLDVRATKNGSVIVSDNVFLDFYTSGMFSMASKNVSVLGNTFTPSPAADQFVSLVANTKLQTAGIQSNSYSDEITIQGNTFNHGVANKGTAIVFADHYGANTPAFATTVVGGPTYAEQNRFDIDLGNFIQLDSLSGSSDQVFLWNPGWMGDHTPVTIMKPVSQKVIALAANNDYGFTTIQEIENKNIDSLDVVGLGKIVLGPVSPVGLDENQIVSAVLYPNPTSDNLNIVLNEGAKSATFQIIDILGNVVYNNTIQTKKTVDVRNLQSGVYFVKMKANNQYSTTKFIKN